MHGNLPDVSNTAMALQRGAQALGLTLYDKQLEALLAYLDLLVKWNRAYNLTAIRDPGDMVIRHLLDSLAIHTYLEPEYHRLIDVGTGGGLPGVPLAILNPQRTFSLLDSNGKKTRFLFQVKTALGLDNMTVHQARVESFQPDEPYDAVLSRAFASLADMIAGCRHLLQPAGHFLAMKGQYPEAELVAMGDGVRLLQSHKLAVPGLTEERHLLDIQLLDATSN